jgi:hypothetical protein
MNADNPLCFHPRSSAFISGYPKNPDHNEFAQ